MPARKIPLVNDQIYHVLNRGISNVETFSDANELLRAIELLNFYHYKKPTMKFSVFKKSPVELREKFLESLKNKGKKLVDIVCFCLMPTHFHLLLKQRLNNGISRFLSNFQNSYTRYYNIKDERRGALFCNQFKAKRITTDEQLLHVSRYIHLNPYTSYVVKDLKALKNYQWSSFPDYIEENIDSFCNRKIILDFFKDKNEYKEFVFDQADYQRELEIIKHLLME